VSGEVSRIFRSTPPTEYGRAPSWGERPPWPGVNLRFEKTLKHVPGEFALVTRGIAVYSTGFSLGLSFRQRVNRYDIFYARRSIEGQSRASLPPDGLLRLGIALSDGRWSTTLEPRGSYQPDGPLIRRCGARGVGFGADEEYWIAPTVRSGLNGKLVVEWPAIGLGTATVPLPMTAIARIVTRHDDQGSCERGGS
jgi:hypothetical protein